MKALLAPGCLPGFTSDGLRLYFYALTAHWGTWVTQVGRRLPQWQVLPELLYGQVLKPYRRYRVARVEYQMQCGQPLPRQGRQRPKRYQERTPAMAAGLTDHRWTVQEFLSFPLPAG